MIRQCKYCGVEFDNMSGRVFSNHVRWCDQNKSNGDKGRSSIADAANSRYDIKYGKVIDHTLVCANDQCKAEYVVRCRESQLKHMKTHCSAKCAAMVGGIAWGSVQWTDDMKRKASEQGKLNWLNPEYVDKQIKFMRASPRFTSIGEVEVREYFKRSYQHDGWTHGGNLSYYGERIARDLYSPLLKVCVEYDGIWHFKDIHGQLESKRKKDMALESWCRSYGWRLIRVDENVYNADKQACLLALVDAVYNKTDPIIRFGNRYPL